MITKRFYFLLLVSLGFLLVGQEEVKGSTIPSPVGDIYVQDFAGILTADEKAELIRIAKELEEETTAQVAVLTIKTTGDQDIAEYANEAFRQYGIGNKEAHNGVLLVVAIDDRKVRIEVGYGLEGQIPDGKAGRILDDYTIPALKADEPNKAVMDTFHVLVQSVKGEYVGGEEQQIEEELSWGDLFILFIVFIVALYIFYAIIAFIRDLFTGGGGSAHDGERTDDYYSDNDSYSDSGSDSDGGGGSSGGGGADRDW